MSRRPHARHAAMPIVVLVLTLLVGCLGPTSTGVPSPLPAPAATARVLPTATVVPPTPAGTPSPTETPVPPAATPPPPLPTPTALDAPGAVAGQIILPDEHIFASGTPAMDLFFENVATEEVVVVSLPAEQSVYTTTLPAGSYYAYAWTPGLAEKGSFTACRPDELCEDHALLPITVTVGGKVTGVDITDWVAPESASLVLAGTLIDGTGAGPLADAALVIREERIVAVGARGEVQVPVDARVIEWSEATLLPGFINAHVHNTQTARNRRSWARGGVTTVRDLGAPVDLPGCFDIRDRFNLDPENARALAAGPLVTVPGGYPTGQFPSLTVTSLEDARQKIDGLIDGGADVIKITLESGAGPILSPGEAAAIVETAHARGIPVSVHVTRLPDLERALDAGVDDIAHMVAGRVPDAVIQRMVAAGVVWVPTLEPFHGRDSGNLRRFIDVGGLVAMGNDSGYIQGLVIGMPMPEIRQMHAAGMTPLEIIVASTCNAAYVCGRASTLGTLEVGKFADVLVVGGDPLQDLEVLENVRLVVHSGVIIREE